MIKKGNGSIGGLVFLIAIFIILYMLVMPPCEKCELLDLGNCEDVCGEGGVSGVLLYDNPGLVEKSNVSVYDLDQINLYIRTDDEIERLASSLFVSRSWFGNVDQDLNFVLEDLNNLEGVYFTFNVEAGKGTLFIELNDHVIFSEKIENPKGKVVELPISYLKKKNHIKLYVDSPGLAFWRNNKYNLRDLDIKQEFERVHHEEVVSFSVSKDELNHLLESNLEFSGFCNGMDGISMLKVYLNDNLIYTESIDRCVSFERQVDVDKEDLKIGNNELSFVIDRGNFLLNPVRVINRLDAELYPSYSFDVDGDVYDFADRYYLSLKTGDGEKETKIIINNYNIDFDSSDNYFEKEITNFVREGSNYLEIVPVNAFNLNEIKIWYE